MNHNALTSPNFHEISFCAARAPQTSPTNSKSSRLSWLSEWEKPQTPLCARLLFVQLHLCVIFVFCFVRLASSYKMYVFFIEIIIIVGRQQRRTHTIRSIPPLAMYIFSYVCVCARARVHSTDTIAASASAYMSFKLSAHIPHTHRSSSMYGRNRIVLTPAQSQRNQ